MRYLRAFQYLPFKRTGVNDWFADMTDRELVNPQSRLSWHAAATDARIRAQIKRIPGLTALRSALR